MTATDPTTQSNYTAIANYHVDFTWNLDWKAKKISGSAGVHLRARQDEVKEVVLDTSYLEISKVEVGGTSTKFHLGDHHEVMGRALTIPLPSVANKGDEVIVTIFYETTDKCTALQWLDKEQTAGKQFGYLFSQCQPIYARSIAPLQDSPSVKITYTASVTSVLPVVMSAIRVSPPSTGPIHDGKELGKDVVEYKYKQPTPLASYILAIAAGNIAYKGFKTPPNATWTSGVWTEPEMMDRCFWEFSEDTTKFVSEAENILTPYRWGVYDILVLPPSFPYGGMENACLTFLTPTLLSGDRALVDVVAHELTHSYFGNGITQKDASSFWLNEGWTTYFERVLQQVLHGPLARDFSFIIGAKALIDSLKSYESRPKYQRLVIDFQYGEDPDDAYSSIPYEKGANFLLYLERQLGGLDVFLKYARNYVETFDGQSIATADWKNHLYSYFKANGGDEKIAILDAVDWDAWLYGEGLHLPVNMEYDTTLAAQAYELAAKWDKSRTTDAKDLPFNATDIQGWNTNQLIVFLEKLEVLEPLPSTHIHALASIYGFNDSKNAEVGLRWFEVALVSPAAKDFAQSAANWVVDPSSLKGRMKFCRPIFRLLYQVDQGLAVKTFEANQTSFHPIARKMIAKDLNISDVKYA
ncbi:Leukotriene A-4 hydrolase homolog Short=LTA-4 hydrolase; AltName: Full=Leukotriene A(4) hydrolase [Serendipita indica DSM 11827]|nr:Leukotriene A-4 hydrolase homolog Short=LTA-4 hydrolase; AltName: Full=Leukotriene A(4) hydrolase [Serendipita indica DSM 11827]